MTMKHIAKMLALGAVLLGSAAWAQQAQDLPGVVSSPSDEAALRQWIQTLGSDEFGGRKPMTEYEDKTVDYLAGELERFKKETASAEGKRK